MLLFLLLVLLLFDFLLSVVVVDSLISATFVSLSLNAFALVSVLAAVLAFWRQQLFSAWAAILIYRTNKALCRLVSRIASLRLTFFSFPFFLCLCYRQRCCPNHGNSAWVTNFFLLTQQPILMHYQLSKTTGFLLLFFLHMVFQQQHQYPRFIHFTHTFHISISLLSCPVRQSPGATTVRTKYFRCCFFCFGSTACNFVLTTWHPWSVSCLNAWQLAASCFFRGFCRVYNKKK